MKALRLDFALAMEVFMNIGCQQPPEGKKISRAFGRYPKALLTEK
jgi:hypothetical protein